MDFYFWDDRTHELDINPCRGCLDYDAEEDTCISRGGCCREEKNKMITKEVLEEMKRKTHVEACCYAIDGLTNVKLSSEDFGFRMGEFRGREDLLDELLALLDNANITPSC